MTVARPILRWHGGKWLLAPWIIEHLPPHRCYVEPFGGAASVLLRKPRSYAEVYNDLDADVVNLFRVLRSQDAPRLAELVKLTPFARDEFELAYEISTDPIEEARRLIIRSHMGFGSDGFNRAVRTGFRSDSRRSGSTPAAQWRTFPPHIAEIADRLAGVVIENKDAVACMQDHDGADTIHYVDPPYFPATRSTKSRKSGERYHAYRHELTREDHTRLLGALRDMTGMVVLSGYQHPVYDEALPGWRRVTRAAHADGARDRTEALWLNPAAQARLHGQLALDAA